ncbi:MAG: SEC-C metal-binding domain-containing protein [Dehalococcoidia bacterium]|nr:SEC-C metal-binding domain-containing protein [Dehalococcoidia bacterium]
MVRPHWYAEHPPACTCANCEEKRAIHRQHGPKIGRNVKCPCGSGRKYKRCHGR